MATTHRRFAARLTVPVPTSAVSARRRPGSPRPYDPQRDARPAHPTPASVPAPHPGCAGADALARRGRPPRRGRSRTQRRRRRARRPPGGRWFWGVVLGLLALNIALGQVIPSKDDERSTSPTRFFRAQVERGQRQARSPPTATPSRASSRRQTKVGDKDDVEGLRDRAPVVRRRRAAEADDREERDASTPSRSTRAARCWPTLLFGFGPTILLVGCSSSCCARAAGGGRRRARRARALARQALRRVGEQRVTLRRRRRHRRGRGRAGRDRRLPEEPRQVPRLGGAIPKGVLLVGPARHGQDAAGAGRGRRGRRAVLLASAPPSSSR